MSYGTHHKWSWSIQRCCIIGLFFRFLFQVLKSSLGQMHPGCSSMLNSTAGYYRGSHSSLHWSLCWWITVYMKAHNFPCHLSVCSCYSIRHITSIKYCIMSVKSEINVVEYARSNTNAISSSAELTMPPRAQSKKNWLWRNHTKTTKLTSVDSIW